jgi:phenylacetate-CoA ligase
MCRSWISIRRARSAISLQCPDHEHYHVQSEHVFVEVLDEDGNLCRPGETGKLFVTSLHNLAMPLIRYDLGDYVEVGPPCPCGRGLPVITRIVGRTHNMLVMPSGERRWPLLSSADIEAMLAIAPTIRQYQFVQKAPELIELRLAVAEILSKSEEARLATWIQSKFGAAFEITFTYYDELPRRAAGKFEEFICEIG